MAETMIDALVRLEHCNSRGQVLAMLIENNEKDFIHVAGTEQTDPQKQVKVTYDPRSPGSVMQKDDILRLSLYTLTAATEAASGNALARKYKIPVTYKDTRTGYKTVTTLSANQMTAKAVTGVSKVWAVSTWFVWDEYTIPAQTEMVFGHPVNPLSDVRVQGAYSIYVSYVA
jgi:hypothetical protein